MDFLNRLIENFTKYGEKAALSDGESVITYSELGVLSGKVYSYLQSENIGKDDFVMISMRRGVYPIVAIVGAIRAGVPFSIVDEDYPIDRKKFIYSDCKCKALIDNDTFEKILKLESNQGMADVDEHDLAYVCYTSGTTGKPKGALHEFGTYNQAVSTFSYNGKSTIDDTDKVAILSSLNFSLLEMMIPPVLYQGAELNIVPTEIVKNKNLLSSYFEEQNITCANITASLLRLFDRFNTSLKTLYFGGEPVKEVYFDNIDLYYVYAQSETGFFVTSFKIDKKYPLTPIGKETLTELSVVLLDDDGRIVSGSDTGEICFINEYFRGYINRTSKVTDDNGYYHSGDMGKILPDGNILLQGRADDMVKINGNRVEPAEIEAVLKEVMNVEWVSIRPIEHNDSYVIAAYYMGEPTITVSEVKALIRSKLPYYMQPSFYIMIDHIPVNANGKFSKKLLPLPDFHSVAAYAPPKDEMERRLIRAFETVLEIKNIGIDDDFFELGGDSIKAIQALTLLDYQELSSTEIFAERTVRKIASYLRKVTHKSDRSISKSADKYAKVGCLLNDYQMFYYNRHLADEGKRGVNLPILLKFSGDVCEDRLCDALEKTIFAHPLLLSKIFISKDGPAFIYDESLYKEIEIENICENELINSTDKLARPYKLIGDVFYHLRLFKTETALYMYLEMHHIISDGTSLHVFLNDMYRAYMGETLDKDAVYYFLNYQEKQRQSDYYRKCREYLEDSYGKKRYSVLPKKDFLIEDSSSGEYATQLHVSAEMIKAAEKKYGINNNALFAAAALITLAKYNNESDVMMSWTYHGRDSRSKKNMVGLLIKDIPIALEYSEDKATCDLLENVKKQIEEGIAHSPYAYTLYNNIGYDSDMTCFLYQMDLFEFEDNPELRYEVLPISFAGQECDNTFSIQILRKKSGCNLILTYMDKCYKKESIERFAKVFSEVLMDLIR